MTTYTRIITIVLFQLHIDGLFRKAIVPVHLIRHFIFSVHLQFNGVASLFRLELLHLIKELVPDALPAIRLIHRHGADEQNIFRHLCRAFHMPLKHFQNTNNDAVRLGNIPAVPFQEFAKQFLCDQWAGRLVDIRPPLDM